ncbi:MAG: type II toxin-antitoxin system YhaV family toxin [Candidatus Baltobacteraceae bacterium]
MATANGWTLYFHPAFKEKFDAAVVEVERLHEHLTPEQYAAHPKVKLFERLRSIIFIEVPSDPGALTYAQGNTLGPKYRHWRRVKFLGRFRLFFRFSTKLRVIIYAWVNDSRTLRHAGAKSDPYFLFEKRLHAGNPPDDWDDLIAQAAE